MHTEKILTATTCICGIYIFSGQFESPHESATIERRFDQFWFTRRHAAVITPKSNRLRGCMPLGRMGAMEQIEAFRMMLFGEVRYEKCVFCGAAAESSDSPVCSLHAAQVR
jgi:hypothetical protein